MHLSSLAHTSLLPYLPWSLAMSGTQVRRDACASEERSYLAVLDKEGQVAEGEFATLSVATLSVSFTHSLSRPTLVCHTLVCQSPTSCPDTLVQTPQRLRSYNHCGVTMIAV